MKASASFFVELVFLKLNWCFFHGIEKTEIEQEQSLIELVHRILERRYGGIGGKG